MDATTYLKTKCWLLVLLTWITIVSSRDNLFYRPCVEMAANLIFLHEFTIQNNSNARTRLESPIYMHTKRYLKLAPRFACVYKGLYFSITVNPHERRPLKNNSPEIGNWTAFIYFFLLISVGSFCGRMFFFTFIVRFIRYSIMIFQEWWYSQKL